MSPRELKKLFHKLSKTRDHLWKERTKTRRHLEAVDDSLDLTQRLEDRARYWIGKARALECPAFKELGRGQGKCMVHNPNWGTTFQNVFRNRCFRCRLQKRTRMKKGVFNGVFGKPSR